MKSNKSDYRQRRNSYKEKGHKPKMGDSRGERKSLLAERGCRRTSATIAMTLA